MEQMKKIIDSKDLEILRQNKHIEKVEKEKQLILKDVQSLQVQLQHTRSEMREKQMECDRLTKSINESEDKNTSLSKQLEGLNNQRDVLNIKLMEHAEEIASLNEKLTNAQSALNRSELQYANRLDDIRLLKVEISNLRSQSNSLSRGLANTTDMRQEVLQLNRSLTQDRIKIKALEQEMSTPMNVHRWRELQGKDPEKMELIDKVQTLQKRVLMQNTEAAKQNGSVNVAQEAVVRMKQFAMKTNSDQQQRLNATQVRDVRGCGGFLSNPSLNSLDWRLIKLFPIYHVSSTHITSSLLAAGFVCANEKVEKCNRRIKNPRDGFEGKELVNGGNEAVAGRNEDGIG